MNKFSLFKDLDKIATQIPVSEIMVTDLKTLREEDSVKKAIGMMSKHSIAGVIVCNEKGTPIGMLSEGDVIKQVFHKGKKPDKVQIQDIMSEYLLTINPDMTLGEASVFMKKNNVSKLPVIEKDKMVGYITKSDLLEKMNEIYYQNTRLRWLPIILVMQFIFILILVLAYINK